MIRAAVRALPAEFRAEYGDEVLLVARDTLRDARASGPAAVSGARGRIFVDLVATAATEHARKGFTMRTTAPGIGYGIAAAVGLPLYLASFGSIAFWQLVEGAHEAFGVRSAAWFHPVIAVIGGLLATIALLGLVGRLGLGSRSGAIARTAAIVVGAGFTLAPPSMLADGAILRNSVRVAVDTMATIGWAIGIVGVTALLVTLGVITLRRRALGAWSIAPLVAGVMLVAWIAYGAVSTALGVSYLVSSGTLAAQLLTWALLLACAAMGAGLAIAPRDHAGHASTPQRRVGTAAPA
ncbi:hypothetical protein [Agromyces mangrovi Wang et al. 2018]|uniref:hypothetical protein n=1 Tax=Agromyces mangrovi TaxID=1858653 RepID=UPI002573A31A|nr:hypothetical protein [Agromyces mangrovi]BDZ63450.1 hypothetical protein GCM10025877_03880 [Agromyces mangrovi]